MDDVLRGTNCAEQYFRQCATTLKNTSTEYGSDKIKEETEVRGIYVCSAAMAVVTAGVLPRRAI